MGSGRSKSPEGGYSRRDGVVAEKGAHRRLPGRLEEFSSHGQCLQEG